MANVKIKTPNGNLPSCAAPKEGVDYDIIAGDPQEGDMILADGKVFCIYHVPVVYGPPDPPAPSQVDKLATAVAALALDVKAIKQKIGA